MGQPAGKALPVLITFLSDPDDTVSVHALKAIGRDYRGEAEPYLNDALGSSDKRMVGRALFTVGWFGYSGLTAQVRKLAWSSDDTLIQLGATMSLNELRDQEAVREIAQTHPNEKVRNAAAKLLSKNKG